MRTICVLLPLPLAACDTASTRDTDEDAATLLELGGAFMRGYNGDARPEVVCTWDGVVARCR